MPLSLFSTRRSAIASAVIRSARTGSRPASEIVVLMHPEASGGGGSHVAFDAYAPRCRDSLLRSRTLRRHRNELAHAPLVVAIRLAATAQCLRLRWRHAGDAPDRAEDDRGSKQRDEARRRKRQAVDREA